MIPHNRYSRIWLRILLLGSLLWALAACAPPGPDLPPDTQATDQAAELQTAAAQNTSIAATVSALQTHEAATALAGQPTSTGTAPDVTPSSSPTEAVPPPSAATATAIAAAQQTEIAAAGASPTPTSTGTAPGVKTPSSPTEAVPPLDGAVDFNGDGYPDLVAGAPGHDWNGQAQAGAFYVFYGGPEGFTGENTELWAPGDFLPDLGGTFSDDIGSTLEAGDFNGDGYTDLAFTWFFSPRHDESGSIVILPGSPTGLTVTGWELWDQNDHWEDGQIVGEGLLGGAEPADAFGYALTAADFNGDGYDDLAAGVPYEDHASGQNQGSVNVIYGSAQGLTHTGSQIFSQGAFLVEQNGGSSEIGDLLETPEEDDLFGYSLASGDINADGFADLVIGASNEDLLGHGLNNSGTAHIVFGSAAGLSPAGNIRLDQGGVYTDFEGDGQVDIVDERDFLGAVEENDLFGAALAVGDFNGDGYDDIAVGVPLEDVESGGSIENAGAVNLFFGWFTGYTANEFQFWTQDMGYNRDGPLPVQLWGGPAEAGDRFGFALAAADFNGDGFDDLAVGAPFEDVSGIEDAGTVSVLYGSPAALTVTRNQFFNQEALFFEGAQTESLASSPFPSDRTGFALTAGDYNRDGYADLVIGAPEEQVANVPDAGGFFVLYGKPGLGLTGVDQQRWTKHGRMDAEDVIHEDIPGEPQTGDKLGGGLR